MILKFTTPAGLILSPLNETPQPSDCICFDFEASLQVLLRERILFFHLFFVKKTSFLAS
jgi:hypothetical protein